MVEKEKQELKCKLMDVGEENMKIFLFLFIII